MQYCSVAKCSTVVTLISPFWSSQAWFPTSRLPGLLVNCWRELHQWVSAATGRLEIARQRFRRAGFLEQVIELLLEGNRPRLEFMVQ